jgi:hypothetical protein
MIITSVVMVLLFLGLVALLVVQREHVQTHDDVQKEQRLKNLAQLNTENEKILTQYRWVDKAKGVVGIPIDRAMSLVLTELQSIQPHPAGPITTPPPAAESPLPGAGTTTGASAAPAPAAAPGGSATPAPAAAPVPAQSGATNP